MNPRHRLYFAWGVLISCVIAWPTTSLTIFAKEPQAVLALSWIALILSALIMIITADVRDKQEED